MSKRVEGIYWNGNRYILAGGYWARFAKTTDNRTMTIFLHREVMSQTLGRPLASYEVVHHKDGVKTNNSPDNLELHTRSSHSKEHRRDTEWYNFICAECGSTCSKPARDVRGNRKKNKKGPFCGRSCAGKHNQRLQPNSTKGSGGRPRKSSWADSDALNMTESGLTISESARRLNASRSAVREAVERARKNKNATVDQMVESTELDSV